LVVWLQLLWFVRHSIGTLNHCTYHGISMVWPQINHQWPTTTAITTMAAATRNGPLLPHTRYKSECLHIGSIGAIPEQANMLFSGNERVYDPQNAPMMRQWWQWILPHHRSILRVIDPLIAKESLSACSGDHLLSIWCVGAGWVAFCVSLGGHFRQRRPWWWRLLLAIGCWLLRAYVRTNPTVGIVQFYLHKAFILV
jgi:hypothetical protein